MTPKRILIFLGLLVAVGIAVWIMTGFSGDILAAVVMALGVALAATWGVRWGSAQARETEEYRQDLIARRKKPETEIPPDSEPGS